ncbi:MAG: hypothetical protein A2512_12350 [Deltaproteobacteria bacterium RIFOXYD12_FULL_56_24]|nr:MAG: hypothetical protein A2512_12350 [Deltaproteobacteria bacterium RIFOXYD12_FULL_56_24]
MPPDLYLITRAKDGDASAFEELVCTHQDRIYNLCRHMLGQAQDAEDAAQDSFLKAYRNLGSFTPDASFTTWLYRIAINTCLDRRKKPLWLSLFQKNAKGEEFMLAEPAHGFTPERLYESKQLRELVQACLAGLPVKLKAALVLKELEGCSYEEIAEALDVSLGTVKSRISRAREELRQMMRKSTETIQLKAKK